MATKKQRIFAFSLALMFLLSTIAFTGIVIYDVYQQRENNQVGSTFDASGGTANPSDVESATNTNEKEAAMLEGTKLEGFDPITDDVTELKAVDLEEGTGEEVKPGATVTAHYTGAYASNGVIFQSSLDRGQPIPFGLDQVIPGWTQGVPGMKVGGKRRLIIPGNLAYGEAPEGYTPGSTERPMGPLIFDIEITAVENQ